MSGDQTPEYRLALRNDSKGELDDVFVRDVSMFRAEMMSDKELWLCCYLDGTGVESDRITFYVSVRKGRLCFRTFEPPCGAVSEEPSDDTQSINVQSKSDDASSQTPDPS